MAYETYLGLQDFFEPAAMNSLGSVYGTLSLPRIWNFPINEKSEARDVFALQTALILDGDYPAGNSTSNECPRSGKFGPCTKAGLQLFQDKRGITGEKGVVGEKTAEALGKAFSAI